MSGGLTEERENCRHNSLMGGEKQRCSRKTLFKTKIFKSFGKTMF